MTSFCSQCGRPASGDASYCAGCGRPLESARAVVPQQPTRMLPAARVRGRATRWPDSLAMAGFCALITWLAFVADQPVPLLRWVDLGIHELGHRLFFWAPDVVVAMMGNGTQSAVPFCLALYFLYRRDWVGMGFCLTWTGETLWYAALYIADAPYQNLPLLHPGGIHDWAFVLGPEHFDALNQAHAISRTVHGVGLAFAVLGLLTCLLPPLYLTLRSRVRSQAVAA